MAKKIVKPTVEQAVEKLGTKVARLKKKVAAAAEGPARRAARKKVKRAQRRKRAVAPKPAAKKT